MENADKGSETKGLASDQAGPSNADSENRNSVVDLKLETGGLVTARGTEEGLILRMDGRVSVESLKTALHNFVEGRRGFLCGNSVTVEWVGSKPSSEVTDEVSKYLNNEFEMTVESARLKDDSVKKQSSSPMQKKYLNEEKELSLFDGIEAIGLPDNENKFHSTDRNEPRSSIAEDLLWDEADARLICATLRSGQKIETEHSLVIFGDVNSGAEIVAGGDIIVLGNLRGVAHAGAYDETGGGRVIFSLSLQPTQLRIGTVISRGGNDDTRKSSTKAEIARVDGTNIVVEPYQSRNVYGLLAK